MANDITHSRLKELAIYDPETGHFTVRTSTNFNVRVGDKLGYLNKRGYVEITLDRKPYRAHRLAWFYVHGVWPSHTIDHRNRVRSDNRIRNLRDLEVGDNIENQGIRANNSTGQAGVDVREGRYRARIQHKGSRLYLGYFDTPEEAGEARRFAKEHLHTHFTGETEPHDNEKDENPAII